MRAFGFHRHGGPEVLEFLDVPDPDPGPGEVRVRVEACALNHLDLWVRQGWPGLDLKLPHWTGSDVTGRVDAVGPGAAAQLQGQAVVVQPGTFCGRCGACQRGEHVLCPDYGIVGEQFGGGLGQYVVVPAANAYPRPAGLTVDEAAAFPLTFLTAYRMLFTKARLRPGERVLVVGGSGGVSLHAALLARWAGARVLATTRSPEKASRLEKLGLEALVTPGPGWSKAARQKLGPADVVVENVGAATFAEASRCLNRGGRLVTCGATTGGKVDLDLTHVFWKHLEIIGSTMGTVREFEEVLRIVEQVRPVVDATFPFERCADATARLERAEQFGKVVVRFA